MSERISPLRRRMIEDMTIRNLSPATQRSYIHAVKRYSLLFRPFTRPARSGRCPDLSGAFGRQGHLLAGVEPDRVCLALPYGVTLAQDGVPERIAYARERQGCRWF